MDYNQDLPASVCFNQKSLRPNQAFNSKYLKRECEENIIINRINLNGEIRGNGNIITRKRSV